jgi:serine/threonine protein kinase
MSQDWNFGKLLGAGANGEAYLAFRRDYITQEPDKSETYVIKKVPIGKEPVLSKSAKLRETQLLAMIKHPYIVTYEDCFIEDGNLFVVMEFAGGGTMEKYCDPGTPVIPLQLLYDTFVQCMLAVAYLHERKIVHRDLKPANVFVLEDKSVKLGDLGEGWARDTGNAQERYVMPPSGRLACWCWPWALVFWYEGHVHPHTHLSTALAKHTRRWQNDPAQQGTIVGTPYYLAPECWRGDSTDLDKADVWAMGVLLYELCGKSCPLLTPPLNPEP